MDIGEPMPKRHREVPTTPSVIPADLPDAPAEPVPQEEPVTVPAEPVETPELEPEEVGV